jgi:proline iminopeptidase
MSKVSEMREVLFEPIEPIHSGYLKVDDIHEIYWEECGNPAGVPVVFLHGGPGAGCSVDHRRLFDPNYYRIILFDQRGAGRSKPFAELKNNTPEYLVEDIEKLRFFLKIKQWLVFVGSWGSTLAIYYGEQHPKSCLGFVLRGIFLMRPFEIDWFFNGIKTFLPEVWEAFSDYIPENKRGNLLEAYFELLTNPDPGIHMPAAKLFSKTEGGMSTLLPNPKLVEGYQEDHIALGLARIEADYMLHHAKSLGENLLKNIAKINNLPCFIIQGRYDLCCPPISAYELSKAWPKATFIMVPDAGHSASEPTLSKQLVLATERFKNILGEHKA